MKKNLLSAAVVAGATLLSMSFAQAEVEAFKLTDSSKKITLDACSSQKKSDPRGTVELVRKDGNLRLIIKEARSCSNVSIKEHDGDLKKVGKLEGGKGIEIVELNEKIGKNKFVVVLASNSGTTSATLNVETIVQPPAKKVKDFSASTPSDFVLNTNLYGRKAAMLADCGGWVEMTQINGQTNLVLHDVTSCSNFDILGENGQDVGYDSAKFDSKASFSMPRKFTDYGNRIKVIVRSNSGKTYDVFTVNFNSIIDLLN